MILKSETETLTPISTSVSTEITTHPVPTMQIEDECFSPIVNFAYYPSDGERPGPSTPTSIKLPSRDWKVFSDIPNLPPQATYIENNAKLEVIQSLTDSERLWIVFEDPENHNIVYYEINTGNWDSRIGLLFPSLFLSDNDTVWMALNPSNTKGLIRTTTVLSVFDESTKRFQSVLRLDDLPSFSPDICG